MKAVAVLTAIAVVAGVAAAVAVWRTLADTDLSNDLERGWRHE